MCPESPDELDNHHSTAPIQEGEAESKWIIKTEIVFVVARFISGTSQIKRSDVKREKEVGAATL